MFSSTCKTGNNNMVQKSIKLYVTLKRVQNPISSVPIMIILKFLRVRWKLSSKRFYEMSSSDTVFDERRAFSRLQRKSDQLRTLL